MSPQDMVSYVGQLKWGIPISSIWKGIGKDSSIIFLFKKQKVGFLGVTKQRPLSEAHPYSQSTASFRIGP